MSRPPATATWLAPAEVSYTDRLPSIHRLTGHFAAGICGGGNRINVYVAASGSSTTASTTPAPTTTTSVSTTPTTTSSAATSTPSWSYVGCYVDTTNPRTLNNGVSFTSQTGQSVSSCLAACGGAGYLYGGTEYGVRLFPASGTIVSPRYITPRLSAGVHRRSRAVLRRRRAPTAT